MKMMKHIVLTVLLVMSVPTFANSEAQNNDKKIIYLSYCMNMGDVGVDYSFQSCVNSNFGSVGRELGGFFMYCSNFGNDVSPSFISCVNSNFSEARTLINNNIFLQNCFNFDSKKLDYSFVSCVNSNYNEISRSISKMEN
jgi:hypothetical protein